MKDNNDIISKLIFDFPKIVENDGSAFYYLVKKPLIKRIINTPKVFLLLWVDLSKSLEDKGIYKGVFFNKTISCFRIILKLNNQC